MFLSILSGRKNRSKSDSIFAVYSFGFRHIGIYDHFLHTITTLSPSSSFPTEHAHTKQKTKYFYILYHTHHEDLTFFRSA